MSSVTVPINPFPPLSYKAFTRKKELGTREIQLMFLLEALGWVPKSFSVPVRKKHYAP